MAIGDYYGSVPTDFKENLKYRIRLRELCARDERAAKVVWEICKSDPLYFFQAVCFLVESRPRFDEEGKLLPEVIPFILWEHQIPAIITIYENLGIRDIAVFKSRGEGFTWIVSLLALHGWIFGGMYKVGLVSQTEDKSDDPTNLDSIGARLDWELARLPTWMVGTKKIDWDRSISDHSWVNYRNMAQINAFAATSNTGRAGRYRWFLADELAFWETGKDKKFMESIRGSTESRLCVSTPNGVGGVFYEMVHRPSNCVRVRVHWTQNTVRNRGLYKIIEGRPEAVDPLHNPIPPEYIGPTEDVKNLFSRLRAKGFRLEGTLRSPWYDTECDRGDSTPQSIAQEYDLDFAGSEYLVLQPEFFVKARDTVCRPVQQGTLDYHPETIVAEFADRGGTGDCKLWVPLDSRGRPPVSTYVIGGDVASGTGGSYCSNSVCQVVDRVTGEQVLEYASNSIPPEEFGELCVAIARWFYDAYLGWEMNFGGGFTARVKALGYNNVYYRTQLWHRSKKKTKEMGWHTDRKTKGALFSDLQRMVKGGSVVLRSEDLVRECGEYSYDGGNSEIKHKSVIGSDDPSAQGEAHGDRVIAMGVAIQLMLDRPLIERGFAVKDHSGPVLPDTLAWRVQQWEHEERLRGGEWDDGTLGEIASGAFLE